MTEDEMVGWYHGFNEHEFEQTLGDSERQGSLACCSPLGSQRVGHDLATEQQLIYHIIHSFKVFNAMAFSAFTELYNHLPTISMVNFRPFIISRRNTLPFH